MLVDVTAYRQEQARCSIDTENGMRGLGPDAPSAAPVPPHPPAPGVLPDARPSATELHELFSVSRNSAARALRLLCREDRIVTAQGGGSFVADELPGSGERTVS